MESTSYVFLPAGVFLPCDHGLNFDISLLFENPITQSINQFNNQSKAFPVGLLASFDVYIQ